MNATALLLMGSPYPRLQRGTTIRSSQDHARATESRSSAASSFAIVQFPARKLKTPSRWTTSKLTTRVGDAGGSLRKAVYAKATADFATEDLLPYGGSALVDESVLRLVPGLTSKRHRWVSPTAKSSYRSPWQFSWV